MTTDLVVYSTAMHWLTQSTGQKSGYCMIRLGPLLKASQGQNQGVSWAGFLTGGSTGEDPVPLDCRTEAPIFLTCGPVHLQANRHTEFIPCLESLISLLLPVNETSAFWDSCDYIDHLDNSSKSADKKP